MLRKDVGHFWSLDARRNCVEPILKNLTENGTKIAEVMMLNFAESGHPVVRATSALGKRRTEKQRKRKDIYSLQKVAMKTLS